MKRNKKLLVSWILGLAYALYLVSYFAGNISTTTGAEQAGAAIAGALVMPHMIVVIIAVIFNVIGWLKNAKGFTLTAAILYAVSIVLFPLYFMFVIIQMILSFLAYSNLKKEIKETL